MDKQYLNYAGLKKYDEKIKAFIAANIPEVPEYQQYDDSAIVANIADLQNTDTVLTGRIGELETSDANIITDLNALKTLVGDSSVQNQISAAIAALVNGAPNALDTLKEIADWINTHGEAAANLVSVVAEQGQKIIAVEEKIDAITAISGTYIEALFLTPVTLEAGQTVQEAIDELNEDEKLVLDAGTVAENLSITKDAVIEAENTVFTGTITVDETAAVTIIGATFNGPVVVA